MTHSDRTDNQVIIGKGQCQSLGVVNRRNTQRNTWHMASGQITDVFITRLKPIVTKKNLEFHIKHNTGYNVKPERWATKYQTYGSYFIPSNNTVCTAILYADLWPAPTLHKAILQLLEATRNLLVCVIYLVHV